MIEMFVYGLSDDIEKLKMHRELTGIGLMVDNTKKVILHENKWKRMSHILFH